MKKEKKKVKIGKYEIGLGRLIDIVIAAILLIIFLTSPKAALIVTQRYGVGTEEQNNSVIAALGEENTEEKFNLYFKWYNAIHEVGHGLMHYNSKLKYNDAEAEQIVNDFAYAYWSYYDETEKLDEVEQIIDYAVAHIENDDKSNINYMEYAKSNWNKKSFYTFNNYGYFQFNSVKESFKNKKDLDTVLKEMGISNYKLSDNKKLSYNDNITDEECDKIIRDAIANIKGWGLNYSDIVYHKYTKNPYNSYFMPIRKIYYDIRNIFDRSLSD